MCGRFALNTPSSEIATVMEAAADNDLPQGPILINARAETIAQKPAFRAACRQRRCLIPISGFYEWQLGDDGKRLPWFITALDMLMLAGIWQDWGPMGENMQSCAIVTCAAHNGLRHIHHRMPVILGRKDWPTWLHETGDKASPLCALRWMHLYQPIAWVPQSILTAQAVRG